MRKGLFPGGNLPYGYVRKNKLIKTNLEEAELVNEIYDLDSRGYTGQSIADELNRRGYKRDSVKYFSHFHQVT